LHTKQAKRQRFKSCFAWNCKGTHQAKAQRKIYCTPTKQSGKGLKAVSLRTGKATHQANPQRKIYCTPNRAKAQRIKKRSRCGKGLKIVSLGTTKAHTQPYGVRMYLDGIITRFWVIVIVF